MSEIHAIRNVAVTRAFIAQEGIFNQTINSLASSHPDEVIIRAINWNGLASDNVLYLLWSNITNDIIGSFCAGSLSPHFPQTRILLKTPLPNVLQFKLLAPVNGDDGIPQLHTSVTGDVAIHLDFITYNKHQIKA